MADDSALVVVAPGDSVDAIIQKVRSAGASRVELLIPDGTLALQALGGFARLRQSLDRDHIGLLVISSDEKTLNAARLNQLDTVGVQGARVAFPETSGNGDQADRYATQVLEAGPRPPITARDAEFLDALDQLPAQDRYAGEDDADLYAALDDLSDAIENRAAVDRGERGDDEDFAAALDEWSSGEDERRPVGEDWDAAFAESSAAPRRRVRAEDMEVSAADLSRQRGAQRTAAHQARAETRAERGGIARSRRGGTAASRLLDLEAAEEVIPRRRGLGLAIPLLILLLIIAAAAVWYSRSRATITVTLPATKTSERPFQKEVIPLTSDAAKSTDAVQAVPVSANAEFSVQGQVISETLTPVGTAKGAMTLINRTEQAIPLPEGTQFIAAGEQGREVRFKLDKAETIPAATTTSSLTGSSTTYGTIDVGVTALSPGSASNVGENTIKQILIPGQPPITTDTSNFLIRHGPITGGSDQPVRIVTEADVQRALQEALTGLYSAGIQALQGQIDARTQGIDPVSVSPDPDALGDPKNYELAVNPPVGQPVDPSNPNFTVTVRTRFSALAAPRDKPVDDQLKTIPREHFKSPCKAGENPGYEVSNRHWDGTKLTIDGKITCTPGAGLASEAINRVKDAVRGKPRDEAEQRLKALQNEGLIGGYALPPDKQQFPSLDFLLTVELGQPALSPTPASP